MEPAFDLRKPRRRDSPGRKSGPRLATLAAKSNRDVVRALEILILSLPFFLPLFALGLSAARPRSREMVVIKIDVITRPWWPLLER